MATNYVVSLTNGLLTINPVGLTLTASNQAKVYGQTLVFAGTEFGASGLVNGDSVSGVSLSSLGALAGAGVAGSPYSIVITNAVGVGLTNYTINYVNGLLTVNGALLGVSANNTNRAYGATNPVFTVSYSGFVNGDGLNVLSGSPVLTTSAVTNSPVGNYTITNTIGTLVATNYVVSLTNGLLTVNPVGLTLTASNQAKVYGQTLVFAGTEFGASGLVNGDSVSGASLSSVGALAGAGVAGSPYSIVITNAVGVGLTNYTINYVNGLLTVNGALLGVSANNTNRAYGATNPVFTVSYSGFVNGDGLNVLSGSPVLTTSAVTNSPVGSYVIANSLGTLVATNYAVSLTNGLLTVNPVGLTLTASNQAKVYGQTLVFAGTEFGASGLVNGDSVSGVSLSSVGALAGAGVAGSPYSIVITNAVGVGLTNYTISYVNGILTVNGALLGVSANNTNRAYGATNPVFTVSYSGFVNGDTTSVLSGSPVLTTSAVTNSPVGNYTITNTIGTLVATNYVVSLTNGLLTVNPVGLTLTASNQAKVYGQTLTFSGTEFGASGLVNGDSVSGVSLSSVGALAGAGVAGSPYSIVITNAVGVGLTNYTINYVNGLLTVNGAVLGVSANNTNRAYGATNPVFTVSYSGFVNGDTTNVLSGAPVLTTGAKTNSPVGSYVITNTIGTLVATNYTVSLTNGLLTVNGALLGVSANNTNRAYGATNPVFTVSYSGFVNGDTTSVLSGAPVLTTSAVTNSPVGNYTITNTIGTLVATNYVVSLTNGLLTVNAAVLGVSANNTNRAYGATNPVFTVSYSGFVNGDTTSVLSGAPVLTTGAKTNSPVGSYVITNTIGTLVATNYTVSLTNGLLTVNGALLGVSANNTNRAYGATNPVFTVSYSGFVNGDTTSVLSGAPVLTTSAVTNSPVGTYTITNSLGTLVATNYAVSLTNGLLTVNPVGLTLTASNQAKVYGQTLTFSGTEFGASGLVNGDSVSGVSLSSVGALAGAGVAGSPYSIVITNAVGVGLTNYTINYVNGLLTVNGAVLGVSANNTNRAYGATNPVFTVSYSGFVNGDTTNVLSGAPVLTTGAKTNSPVGSYVITNTIGTLVATNYTVSLTNGLLTVNGALLGVSANNTNRAYGATNPVFTVSYSGFVNGDTTSVLSGAPVLTTSAVTNSPVGNYTITNTIGTLVATNYVVSLTNGLLTVNAAVLGVSANNTNRAYGATNPVFTVSYSGFVNGDTTSVLSGAPVLTTSAVTNSPVGNYTITNTIGTLVATNYVVSLTNGLLTVNAAVLGVSANNTNRAYGATNPVFTVSYSGFVNGDTTSVLSGAPVLTTGAKTNSPVGNYTITNTIGTLVATNYVVSLTNGLLTVNGALLGVSANNTNRAYGATNPVFTVSYSGFVNGDTTNVLSGAPVLTTGAKTNSPVGSYVITNTIGTLVATNYTVSLTNGLLTVNGALLGVSANNTNRAYGATNPVFTVSYSGFVNGDTTNVLSGAPVLTTGAKTNSPVGSYVITNTIGTLVATNYTVSLTNGLLTVNGALLGVSANNTNRAYGATNPVFTVSYSGFVNGDTTSVLSGAPVLTTSAVTNSPVGNYTITNTIGTLVATNYVVSLTNGLLTINPVGLTLTASNQAKVYGQTLVFAGTEFGASGLVNGDSVSSASLSSVGALAGAGVAGSPYSIVITNAVGVGLTNYTINYVNGLLTVNGALLGVSANNTNRAYGATNPVFAVSYSGFVNGDGLNVLSGAPVLSTSARTNSPVGTYTITNSIGNLVATNYVVSLTNGLLTINPALLGVSANNTNRAYGATNPVFTVSYSGFVNGDTTSVLSGSPVLTTSAVTNSPIGTYTITNSLGNLVATNYTVSLTNGLLTVNAAVLGVSANNTNRAYGATNPVFTVSYSGFVNGDGLNVLSGAPVLTTGAKTNSPVGSYVITNTIGTLVATNYVVSLTNGTLTVTGAVLTATVNTGIAANNKVYDGTTAATISLTNAVLTGVVSGDTISLSTNGYTANFASAGVGTNIPVTVSGLTLSGAQATNYTLIQPIGLTANITAKALTISAPTPVITSINVTSGMATITWNSVPGGIYRVQYINSLNGGGWTDLSPDVTATGSTATQTNAVGNAPQRYYRIVLLNFGLSANNKVYDGTTAATISLTNAVLVGVVNGDSVSLVTNGYTANFASAGVGTNIPVTVSGLTLSGAKATNYTLIQPIGLTANITAATLTYTANAAGMTYGTAVPALSGTVSGFVGSDTQGSATTGTLTFTTMATSSSGVGSYAVNGSGLTANNGNYTFVQAAGNATALTISALPVNLTGTRGYDGTATVLAGILTVGNEVGSDNVTVASGSGTLAGASVGIEAITSFGTLSLGGPSAGNYTLTGASGSVNITVTGVTITSGITANNKPYDGTTAATISSNNVVLSGVLAADAGNVRLSTNGYTANFASAGVGTSIPVSVRGLKLTGSAAANYTLTPPVGLTANITAIGVSITSGITANNKVYDGTTAATINLTNVILTGAVSGDTVSLSANSYTANFASAGVGTNIPVTVSGLTLSGAQATNYTLIQPTGLTANITAKALTISAPTPVITSINVTSGVATITWNSVPGGIYRVQYINSLNGGGWTDLSPDVTATGATATQTNAVGNAPQRYYRIVLLNLGMSANDKVYDGTTAATIGLTDAVLAGVVNGDSVSLVTNGYTANFASAGVGTNIPVTVSGLTLSGSAAANYTLTQPVGLTANITAKALTVGSAVPTPVITSIRLANGVVTITWNSATGGIYRVQYINSLNGGGWTNLSPDVTATGSTASQTNAVGNAPQRYYRVLLLNPGLSANNKVYDGTTAATINLSNVVLVGVVNGDSVNLVTNGYTANFASAGVGTNISVTVGGLTLGGASAGNYTLTQPVGLTANIVPATLTVSAANESKTYGLPNPPLTVNFSGFVSGEGTNVLAGTPSLSTSATINSPPGTYAIVVSAGTLSATNYIFAFVNGTLTVNAPQLSIVLLNGNQFTLAWPTIASQTYQLEYTTNLAAATWTLLGGSLPGTGNPIIVTNGLGVSPQRYFRLSISP